jgi:Flp pilus assembly protein TadG
MSFTTEKFSRLARRFAKNRKGSVATLSALALIPIVIAAGAGLDVSRAMMGRGSLQDALDSTALMLAHLPSGTPNATLQSKGQAWLNANIVNSGLGTVTLVVTPATGKIVLDASSSVPTVISKIAGISNVPVTAHSEVKWGLSHVELALVLDNTGSMAGQKLATLKAAANELVDTLAGSTDTTDANALKISVVPFSMTVKIGSGTTQLNGYKTASWMKGALPYKDANNQKMPDIFTASNTDRFTMFDNVGESWGGCVEARPAPYDVQDTAPTSSVPNSYFVPYFAPDEPDDNRVIKSSGGWGGTQYYHFSNNYIDDNVGTATYSAANWKTPQGKKSKYAKSTTWEDGPNEGCAGLASLLRMTTSISTVKAKISSMNASGNTNVPFGAMWGWHTLSPNAPFGDGVAYNDGITKKIMVVLTDGDNTNTDDGTPNAGAYSGLGYIWQKRLAGADETSSNGARTAAMDARLTLLCTNAKAAGITIYTVRIDMSGSAPPALMNCASEASMFYDVPDVANLSNAFDSIAGSIGKLRISN